MVQLDRNGGDDKTLQSNRKTCQHTFDTALMSTSLFMGLTFNVTVNGFPLHAIDHAVYGISMATFKMQDWIGLAIVTLMTSCICPVRDLS